MPSSIRKVWIPTCYSDASDVSCNYPLVICGLDCSWRANQHVVSAEVGLVASLSYLSFPEGLGLIALDREIDR